MVKCSRVQKRTLRWNEFFKFSGSRENEEPPLFTSEELPCCLTTSQIRSEERVAIAAVVYVDCLGRRRCRFGVVEIPSFVYAPASGKVRSAPEEQ
jgi:hypothetical protein